MSSSLQSTEADSSRVKSQTPDPKLLGLYCEFTEAWKDYRVRREFTMNKVASLMFFAGYAAAKHEQADLKNSAASSDLLSLILSIDTLMDAPFTTVKDKVTEIAKLNPAPLALRKSKNHSNKKFNTEDKENIMENSLVSASTISNLVDPAYRKS